MDRLTMKKKLSIIKHYLSGLAYREISPKVGVSVGAISNVIAEFVAGNIPEATDFYEQADSLRELSIALKRLKLTPGQCLVGIAVLNRIKECGLNPSDIDRWPSILKAASSEAEAQELVNIMYRFEETLRKTGLSPEELDEKVRTLEKKADDLAPTIKRYEECRQQLTELSAQRDKLTGVVNNLEEKRKLLSPIVEDLEKRKNSLTTRLKTLELTADKADKTLAALNASERELQAIGFSAGAMVVFSRRLKSIAQKHKILSPELKERLLSELENLDKGLGLETLIHSNEQKLDEITKAIAIAKRERDGLVAAIASLNQQKSAIETTINETRDKVAGEIQKIVPLARGTIAALSEELKRAQSEAISQVESNRKLMQGIRAEALNAVKEAAQEVVNDLRDWGDMRAEIGKYQEEMKLARYFTALPMTEEALASLVQDINATVVLEYLIITRIWCQKKLNPKLRPPPNIIEKYGRISESTKVELANVIDWVLTAFLDGVSNDKG